MKRQTDIDKLDNDDLKLARNIKPKLFTRAQSKGISLDAMKAYRSIHGWDEETGDFLRVDGLACCNGLAGDMNFGNADTDDSRTEIVVFSGRLVEHIYDGCVAEPVKIIARFVPSEYKQLAASGELWNIFDDSVYEF